MAEINHLNQASMSHAKALNASQAGKESAEGTEEMGEKFLQLLQQIFGTNTSQKIAAIGNNPLLELSAKAAPIPEKKEERPVKEKEEAPIEDDRDQPTKECDQESSDDSAPVETQEEVNTENNQNQAQQQAASQEQIAAAAAALVKTANLANTQAVKPVQTEQPQTTTPVNKNPVPEVNLQVKPETNQSDNLAKNQFNQQVLRQVAVKHEGQVKTGPTKGPELLPETPVEQQQPQLMPKDLPEVKATDHAKVVVSTSKPLGIGEMAETKESQFAKSLLQPITANLSNTNEARTSVSDTLSAKQTLAQQLQNFLFQGGLSDGGRENSFGSNGTFKGSMLSLTGFEAAEKKASSANSQTATSKIPQASQVNMIEKIQKMLENAVKNRDSNSVVLHLDPPELGELTVKITQRSDQVFARITPESPEVEHFLRSKLPEISSVLTASGLKTENIHISIGAERLESEAFRFNNLLERERGSKDFKGEQEGRSNRASAPSNSNDLNLNNTAQQVGVVESGWVA